MSIAAALGVDSFSEREELFEINFYLSNAILGIGLGGVMVFQCASAFGGTTGRVAPLRRPWWVIAFVPGFAAFVVLGQGLVSNPGRALWLFPFVNVAIVALPSFVIATTVTARYMRSNDFAWPVSFREWIGAAGYGAIGATTIAGVINTLWLIFGGAWFIHTFGEGDAFELSRNLDTIEGGWGVLFDLSVLSVVAPLNEEFFKGLIVALFFFRKGNRGRCYLWGVLAGSGFNMYETFGNSLGAVSPDYVDDQTIANQWWIFAIARVGGAILHGAATGFAALACYGLLRRRWRLVPLYFAGVLLHASWNASVYVIDGKEYFSEQGPDSTAWDVVGIGGLVIVAVTGLAAMWLMSGRVRDGVPAPIYRLLGMVPAAPLLAAEQPLPRAGPSLDPFSR